ncbi:hypothetical protein CYMTET_12330 [Cymbomonas tetramitiformis]|uniref:8-oxo-dGTP diphosphatase n=1 Tax=Cymbomonas tetramitiformis TaxID=36881 RepID=A0AAE0GKU4_9CHLO|nr:hypothetical protein CYMTET_12330 [Cymbomonas tetramitiformis]
MATSPEAQPPRKLVLVVAAALLNQDGEVLLAQRPQGKPMSGLWEFPGGKVDPGESPEAALKRELREELDVIVEEQNLEPLTFASHAYDSFNLLMPLYVCREWVGTPSGVEGQQLAWVDNAKLDTFEMPAADIPLIGPVRSAMKKTIVAGKDIMDDTSNPQKS